VQFKRGRGVQDRVVEAMWCTEERERGEERDKEAIEEAEKWALFGRG